MVDEIVKLEAPRASVNPVGALPNLEMLPRSDVAAAVPVPDVVPPADSTVRLIELSTVPVTVRVPELLAAAAIPLIPTSEVRSTRVERVFMALLSFWRGVRQTNTV